MGRQCSSPISTPERIEDRAILLRWAEQRLDRVTFDRYAALPVAVRQGGRLVAVAVYHERRGPTFEMSIAADTPRWATRGVIGELLATPFGALGCRRITAIIRADNARSRRFVEGIGFRQEGVLRDGFEDCDAVIYGMTRGDYLAGRFAAADLRKAA